MKKKSKKKIKLDPQKRRWIIKKRIRIAFRIFCCAAFVCASALISFGGSLGVPDWNDVLVACGIGCNMKTEFSVSFINVGSADCALAMCGDENILIDGGSDLARTRIFAYLERSGVEHLNAVIVSHPDGDHIGSMTDIIEKYGVGKVYMSEYADEHDIPAYTELLSVIGENKITVIHPDYEQVVSFGDMSVCFYPPDKDYGSTNDNSLMAMLTYAGKRFLFTGDASSTREAALLEAGADISCDVLKVGHHGSKKSSSAEFLTAVNAEYAVISVSGDDVQLPDYATVASINKYCGTVYRTDNDYTVRFTLKDGELKAETEA